MAIKHISAPLKIKKAGKDGLVIEGLANAATYDRMKERILPSAWDLENYKKNPVILFDHGHDPTFGYMPIGKAIAVEAKDEGLYVKALISSSKSERISAVRDLIDEGILKTFSVGFDPKASEKAKGDDPEAIDITKAELIENSVVPIPMNQDSTFTMLRKRKSFWETPMARKWYDQFLDRVALIKKGAWVAAALHQRMADLIAQGGPDRDQIIEMILYKSGGNKRELHRVLCGVQKTVAPKMLAAISEVLRIDAKHLQSLTECRDEMLLERIMAREETKEDTNVGAKKKPAKKKKIAKGNAVKQKNLVVTEVRVPKDSVESPEEAAKLVEAAEYMTDKMTEDGDAYVFAQPGADEGDLERAVPVDLGDGAVAIVAPKKSAGGESEATTEEEGMGENDEEEEKSGDDEATTDDEKALDDEGSDDEGDDAKAEDEGDDTATTDEIDAGDTDDGPAVLTEEDIAASVEAFNEEMGKEGAPSWAADAGRWAKAQKIAEAAGVDDYAFLMWTYLVTLGGAKKSGASRSSTKNIEGTDDNPYLELAKGQTAVLGAILQELKGMNGKMDGLAEMSLTVAKLSGEDLEEGDEGKSVDDDEGKDDESAKSLDLLRNYQRDLDKRLKRLNV